MASFFFSILCCFGRRYKDQSSLDENSRLIPTREGEFTAGNLVGTNAGTAFDRAVFKDRLGGIVRSKESYMVNVSSPLPFNLHNKPRALIDIMTQGSHLSSSSRSASTSTFREGQSPVQPHLNSRPPAPVHTRSELRLTPVNYASQSRSRSASHSSISSVTSSRKGERRVEEVGEPSGILGVRLVRGPGAGYSAQRGRAKGKRVEEAGSEPAILNVQSVTESEDLHAERMKDTQNVSYPQVSISPASDTFEFRLHEIGALSASWGD